MYELTVRNSQGASLRLNPSADYSVASIDGLTPEGASVFATDFTGADGAQKTGARIGVRNVVIAVVPTRDVERGRVALYEFFRAKEEVTVSFRNGARDVRIDGTVESFEGSLFDNPQTLTASIVCPQPYWRDAAGLVDQLYSVLDMFEFPFAIDSIGVPFSEVQETLQIPVRNEGESETGLYVTMTAHGTVRNPVLFDGTRRTYFGIEAVLNPEDVIVLDTRRGSKGLTLVRDGFESNIINCMAEGSTWLQLPIGETVFALDADSNAELLDVRIHHDTLYQGV